MNFQQVVTGVISGSTANLEMRSCPDQIYGKIKWNGKTFFVKEDRKDIAQRITEQPAIIIVLESPHTKEFQNVKIEPAKGYTGDNIRDYLLKRFLRYLPSQLKQDGTEIILVNAIQYQCSLGDKDTSVWRDKVFTAAWNCFGEQCFQSRLEQVLQKEDFLINGCTKGNDDIEWTFQLRRLVEDAIKAAGQPNGSDLHTMHPSCWNDPSNKNNDFLNQANKWLWGPSHKKYVGKSQ